MISAFSSMVDRIRFGDYALSADFPVSKNFRKWDQLLQNFH